MAAMVTPDMEADMSGKPRVESPDALFVIKGFPILKPVMTSPALKKSLRLLCVFGYNGTEVLYQTVDDEVYGVGNNRFGCLGVGVDGVVTEPKLNATLSGRRVVDIYNGFGHCLALTADGRVWGWGENDFGQCGVGHYRNTNTPAPVARLANSRVVRLSCGNRHTMALTIDGHVYAWGRNTFGQCGDNTVCWRAGPVRVDIGVPVVSMSCGKCHSIALSCAGVPYVWGLNDFGQLGRHRERDLHPDKDRAFAPKPSPIHGFDGIRVVKALCGPNHTFLLTDKGCLYGFGLNETGQVGNRSFSNQWTPVRIDKNIKFRDVVVNYDNNLSIAISCAGRIYCWGFKRLCSPVKMSESVSNYTIFDVYAKYSGINKTYESIIFSQSVNDSKNKKNTTSIATTNGLTFGSNCLPSNSGRHDNSSADSGFYNSDEGCDQSSIHSSHPSTASPQTTQQTVNPLKRVNGCPAPKNGAQSRRKYRNRKPKQSKAPAVPASPVSPISGHMNPTQPSSPSTSSPYRTVTKTGYDMTVRTRPQPLQPTEPQVFDRKCDTDYDLRLAFADKSIYCHKSFLKHRNAKFWANCETHLLQSQGCAQLDVIYIKTYNFEAFNTFIAYLYGIQPVINCQTYAQLAKLAALFDEPPLAHYCRQCLPRLLTLATICALYKSSIDYGVTELERECVEFAASNSVIMSSYPQFLAMTGQMYRRLLDATLSI